MRPISDSDSDVRDRARDPDDGVPAQREPDHDGQLYVGASHPDTDLTPDEATHHEPIAVDDGGAPVDRDRDDHEASALHTADDEAARDEARHDVTTDEPADHDDVTDDEFARHEVTEDVTADDETDDVTDDEVARDETDHDETDHDDESTDEPTAHDETAPFDVHEDEPTPVEAAHGFPADDGHAEPVEPVEPPAVMVTPLGPAQVVAVPGKPEDRAEPAADLDHDDAAAEPAAEPAVEPAATELKPGDVPVAPVAAFLTDDASQDLRQRWREAQLGFVDDPRQAAEDVRSLVNEAIDKVIAALQSQRDELASTAGEDTEQYRVTVQRCRAFFDRVLNL